MFQFLRLSPKFLAVLLLSVNPIETLYSLHSLSPEGPGSDGASSTSPGAVDTSWSKICFDNNIIF